MIYGSLNPNSLIPTETWGCYYQAYKRRKKNYDSDKFVINIVTYHMSSSLQTQLWFSWKYPQYY